MLKILVSGLKVVKVRKLVEIFDIVNGMKSVNGARHATRAYRSSEG